MNLRNCKFCKKRISEDSKGNKRYCNSKCRDSARYLRDKNKITIRNKLYATKHKDQISEYLKKYYQENKEKIKKRSIKRHYNNREQINIKKKEYYQENKKDFVVRRQKNWKKILEQERERKRTDPNFSIKKRLRGLFSQSLKAYTKKGKMYSSKKYSIDYGSIIKYLQPFPQDLENWHIDHIKPLSKFEFANPDGSTNLKEIKKAFAPENHQWLLAEDNLKKSNKWDGD